MAINWDEIEKKAKRLDEKNTAKRGTSTAPSATARVTAPVMPVMPSLTLSDKLNVQSRLPQTSTPLMQKLSGMSQTNAQPMTPLMAKLSVPIPKPATEVNDTPNLAERLSKQLSGMAKTGTAGSLNTFGYARRVLDSGIQGDTRDNLMDFNQREKERLEKELADPKTNALKRWSLEREIRDLDDAITGRDRVHEKKDELMASGTADFARAQENASWLGKLGLDVLSDGAQLVGDVAVGKLLNTNAMLPMAIRAFGSGAHEAEQGGANLAQQGIYGGAKAGVEVLTEKLSGGLAGAFGKGAADGIVEEVVAALGKSEVGRNVIRLVMESLGEGAEEFIADAVDPILRSIYNGQTPIENYKEEDVSDWTYSALVGAAIGGLGGGVDIARGGYAAKNAMLIPQAQDVAQTPSAVAPALQDIAPTTPTIDSTPQKTQPAVDLSAPIAPQVKLPTETLNAVEGAVEPVNDFTTKPNATNKIVSRLSDGESVDINEIYGIPEIVNVISQPVVETYLDNSPERQAMRNKISENLFLLGSYSGVDTSGKPLYNGVINSDKHADIVIGVPAAGKSSVLVNPMSKKFGSRIIDSDMAKELLPEYNGGVGAANVHRESSIIRNSVLTQAIVNGDNIVFPTVGDDYSKLLAQINDLKDAGYSVSLHLNELDARKATGRAINRFLTGGRYIDPRYVLDAGDKPTQNYKQLKQIGGLLYGYSHYSNDVEKGQPARPIKTSDGERNIQVGNGRRFDSNFQSNTGIKGGGQATSKNSLGAKLTNGMPEGTGAMSADFEYKEAPTESKAYDAVYTDMEKAAIPELQNTHQVKADKGVDARVQERFDFDYEGEKADLFNSKRDWDVDDTRLAAKILESEVSKARQTRNWDEVVRLQKKYAAQGTDWGQVGRQRQRFANTPTEIISEAADTLATVEQEDKKANKKVPGILTDAMDKKTSENIGKSAKQSATEAANEIKQQYGSGRKPKGSRRGKNTIDGNQAGEPFTFEYEEKVGELVANYIEKANAPKKPKQTTFLKDIANEIKAFAKDTVPSKPKTTTKITAVDRLRDYLQNKDFYSNAWSDAQDALRRKYAGDPEMLEALSAFTDATIGFNGKPQAESRIMVKALVASAVESGETKAMLQTQEALGFTKMSENIANELIQKTGATGVDAEIIRSASSQYVNEVLKDSTLDAGKTVNAKVNGALKDIGVKLSEIVTKSSSDKANIKRQITKLLVDKYGFGQTDAENVASVVKEHFDKLVEEKTAKRLETIFNRKRSDPKVRSFIERLGELRNMGVFDNEKYAQAASEKLFGALQSDLSVTTPKFKALLGEISEYADRFASIKRGDTASIAALIKDLNATRKTTGMFSKETSKQMSEWLDYAANNLADGEAFLRDVAAQQIRNIAADYQKTSVLNAIKSYRIMGMLSKVTTLLRNFVANGVVDPTDSIATDMVVPIDIALSKYTKTRAVPVDLSWASEAKRKGSVDGFVKSAIQVGLDANVSKDTSKYETNSARTFKMTGNPVERFLSTWSKWENYALQSTDEFAKGGIAAETQRGIDKLKSRGLMAQDALQDRAGEVAKQRTLQNDGALATAMLKGRDALNVLGAKDKRGGSFGLGDLAMPFAKVPANATAMLGNYTPAGLVKAAWNLGKTFKQAHDGTLTAEQQARAVTDLGRALSGTAGVAMFTALAVRGIIKVAGSDDKDEEALQTSEGQRGTQFNVDALTRWLSGKNTDWRSGDTLISLGFLEQLSGQMVMGAMIAEAYMDDGNVSLGDVVNANATAIFQAVLELPAMSQLTEMVNGYKYSDSDQLGGKLADAAISYGASQAASFVVPNIVGGVATGLDGTARDLYTSENPIEQARDSILSKIPFARNTLPAKLDNFGNERKYTGNSLLDILNANILPGQVGKYNTSAVNQELYRLSDTTGDVKYPARNAPRKVLYDNESYELTDSERTRYQKTAGGKSYDLLSDLLKTSGYKDLPDERKAKLVEQIIGYSTDTAKREYVGDEYESSSYEKVYEAEQDGIEPTQYFMYKDALEEIRPEGGTPAQYQYSKAINTLDLSTEYKSKLWEIQKGGESDKNPFTGALAQKNMSPEDSIKIMEEYSKVEKEMEDYVDQGPGLGKPTVQAAYFLDWLSRQYTQAEVNKIYEVFDVWGGYRVEKPSVAAKQYVKDNPR